MAATRLSPLIKTSTGFVQGKTFEFENKFLASAYCGIPYAEPPVGDLRFKKPAPVIPWTGVKECTKFGKACPYISPNPTHKIECDEDCLFLNVFAPEIKETEKELKPVCFYIHGGAFLIDCAELVGDEGICKYLCSKDVIVVTVNYRLGIFGFLTLDNDEVKGNFGLWDMALALCWVRDNIHAFGGDPNRITVAGQSAGGVAVDLLTLSPHTRDLFAHAIIFAGTSYGSWFSMDAERSRKTIVEYAKHRGCQLIGQTDEEVNREVLKFFQEKPADELKVGIYPDPEFKFLPDSNLPLSPTFDGDFFPASLEELRKSAPRKPIVNGITEHEGLLMCARVALVPELTYKNHAINMLCSTRLNCSSKYAEKLITEAMKCDLKEESHEHTIKWVKLVSDFMFNESARRFAIERTKLGDCVYNFVFTHYKKGSLGAFGSILPFEAATHCMELPYFFGKSILGDFEVVAEDEPVIDRFTTYLTAFMKTGDPNNQKYTNRWEPVDEKHPGRRFVFGTHNHETRDDDNELEIWNRVFK